MDERTPGNICISSADKTTRARVCRWIKYFACRSWDKGCTAESTDNKHTTIRKKIGGVPASREEHGICAEKPPSPPFALGSKILGVCSRALRGKSTGDGEIFRC
ncbi:MAG: hypothetical protein U1F16_08175 [Turneriella sp.]